MTAAAPNSTRILETPECVYVVLALAWGSVLVFLTPPMQVPDEGAHFERAWQIAEGTIIPTKTAQGTGGMLPVSLNDFCRWFEQFNHDPHARIPQLAARYRELWLQPVHDEERMFVVFSNTAAYPPLPYLPQAAAIFAVRGWGGSVLACLIASRWFNLVAAAALHAWAIRRIPVQKWTLALLGLTPMSVFLAASASSDAVTNALCALFVANVLRLAWEDNGKLSRTATSGLMILSALLGLVKQGYYPLALLILLIPWRRKQSRRPLVLLAGTAILVTAVTVAAWGSVVRATYSPMADRVDPQAQLNYIVSHPGQFAQTLIVRLFAPKFLWRHAEQFLGFLGTLDTPLPAALLVLHGALIGLAAVREPAQNGLLSWGQRGWVGSIVLINYILLGLTIYLTWMGVGSNEIRLQGRYLIPLGLPACLLLQGLWPIQSTAAIGWRRGLVLFVAVEAAVVFVALSMRYYEF